MALISLERIWSGRSGSWERGRHYTSVFRGEVNNRFDTAAVVLAGSPPRGSFFADDTAARLYRRRADADSATPFSWLVTLDFSTEAFAAENPLDAPPEIEWETEQHQELIASDIDGDAILNAAGDRLDEPVDRDDPRLGISIRANVPAAVPAWILTHRRAINIDDVVIDGVAIPAGLLRVRALGLSRRLVQDAHNYREARLVVQRREPIDGGGDDSPWDGQLLNQGFRDAAGLPAILANGIRRDQPALLDLAGNFLENPTPENATYIRVKKYPRLAYAGVLPGFTAPE